MLVGFHTCAAGDKSFAMVSVSLTYVMTYDKLSDTALCILPIVPLLASAANIIATHRSSTLPIAFVRLLAFSQSGDALMLHKANANVVR